MTAGIRLKTGVLLCVGLWCVALLTLPTARAGEKSEPTWGSLTPVQQQQLAPLRGEWSGIDAQRKQKWLTLAGRLDKLPPEERQRVRERMSAWAGLPDGERTRARQQFQESRRLSLDERQARWLEYQALSDGERRELVNQAADRQQRSRKDPSPRAEPAAQGSLQSKHNTMPLPDHRGNKPVAPAIVQARPGATTNPVSKSPQPASFQQPGLPKIAATPDFVDPTTLLPRRGAQAAATMGRKPGNDDPKSDK